MKKYLFFATVALAALASCSESDFVGDESVREANENGAIVFGTGLKAVTRADHVGADAAGLLNNKFIVGGFKVTESGGDKVFDNYIVNWVANTAATTTTNTSDWEYVGVTAAAPSGISGAQTIKYWDYSTDYYDFIAYSTGTAEPVNIGGGSLGSNNVRVRAIDWDNKATKAYTLGGDRADLAKCYIADLVTVYKADQTPAQPKYQDEVQLTFRNLASKVRVALYETVPGYSVKDVKFYTDNSTEISTGASATSATLFTTGTADKDNFYTHGTYSVYFPTTGSGNLNNSDYNKAHVSFTPNLKQTTQAFGELDLKGKDSREAEGNYYLGRTSATASYAGTAAPWYTIMLPNEEGTVLELRVDYTLLSIDGSGEEIKVHGATAFVPAIYAAWKPNYAYTYIFKISDNTNGWTSTLTTDPAGLYPITFDAVVVDSEKNTQSTITTVASPSITTYQKGHDYADNEYDATKGDIYVQVMQDGSLLKLTETDHPVQVWEVTANTNNIEETEANVMDALNIRTAYDTSATTGRNGLTLTKVTTATDFTTIPGVDGNDITIDEGDAAKFTPSAGKTYVFTYKGTYHPETTLCSAEVLSASPSDWSTNGVWYKDPDGTEPVDATATFVAGTYYKKYTNRNIDWAVKVIKVAEGS